MNESPAHHKPITLGQLKATGWRSKTVKQEMHDRLLAKLSQREKLFSGIVGYDDTKSVRGSGTLCGTTASY